MITKSAKPAALLVTSQFNQTVREYNGTTGATTARPARSWTCLRQPTLQVLRV
jgi:hypothetical protein